MRKAVNSMVDYEHDLDKKVFGYLEVLYKDKETTSKGKSKWVCKCGNCGKIKSIPRALLISGHTKSCGCVGRTKSKNMLDLTDKDFGDLKVKYKVSGRGLNAIWHCECKCGKEKDIVQSSLTSGSSTSCGCASSKKASDRIKDNFGIKDGTSACKLVNTEKAYASNKSTKIRGVYKNKKGVYIAMIGFCHKLYYLGSYKDIESAIDARKSAENAMFGDFLEWYAEKYPEHWEHLNKSKNLSK